MSTPFAELIAASLQRERFTVVDVGCSGGLDPAWRVFGHRLRALGFDASVAECARLSQTETNPDIEYVAGFVDLAADHPFTARRRDGDDHRRNPYPRLSVTWAMELRRKKLETASHDERLQHNAWQLTDLADPAENILLPAALAEHGFDDIDFLKIDIDGPDFRVLNALDGRFDALAILALRLEVNFYGGPWDTAHSFHNTDRFMREQGFELFGLDNRRYSARALPARFTTPDPGQTATGRLYQADAYYARDACAAYQRESGAGLGPEKLAKLAAIFSIWRQPDVAAELLLAFRERLAGLLDIDKGLDLLAAETQSGAKQPLAYADYMALFAADSPGFYKRDPPPPGLLKRLKTAWRAFNDPNNAFPPND